MAARKPQRTDAQEYVYLLREMCDILKDVNLDDDVPEKVRTEEEQKEAKARNEVPLKTRPM